MTTLAGLITHNGEPDGIPIGVCFRHPGWEAAWDGEVGENLLRFRYPDGAERLVYTDGDGRALMVGWFPPGAFDAL